jgi:hypothetical protein
MVKNNLMVTHNLRYGCELYFCYFKKMDIVKFPNIKGKFGLLVNHTKDCLNNLESKPFDIINFILFDDLIPVKYKGTLYNILINDKRKIFIKKTDNFSEDYFHYKIYIPEKTISLLKQYKDILEKNIIRQNGLNFLKNFYVKLPSKVIIADDFLYYYNIINDICQLGDLIIGNGDVDYDEYFEDWAKRLLKEVSNE